jgi:long-chain-fatty-acid--CoA ligase ACSBG
MVYSLANFLILKRIKQVLGLDQCNFFFFGAAPMKKSSIDYFASLDMPLFNMYGLSETTGSTTISLYNKFSLNHAGLTMSGAHIKISDPDEKGQGEILVKGRHIMMGYYDNEEATRETIDNQGYFKTGD